jgi:hypothetical protein
MHSNSQSIHPFSSAGSTSKMLSLQLVLFPSQVHQSILAEDNNNCNVLYALTKAACLPKLGHGIGIGMDVRVPAAKAGPEMRQWPIPRDSNGLIFSFELVAQNIEEQTWNSEKVNIFIEHKREKIINCREGERWRSIRSFSI